MLVELVADVDGVVVEAGVDGVIVETGVDGEGVEEGDVVVNSGWIRCPWGRNFRSACR